jgi:hypothetical protein
LTEGDIAEIVRISKFIIAIILIIYNIATIKSKLATTFKDTSAFNRKMPINSLKLIAISKAIT